MKKYFLFAWMTSVACNELTKNPAPADATILITNDTIPEIRKAVKEVPVAKYSEPVKDALNDWQFSVSAYETERTFHFLLRMQYKELRISDSLQIPNFGTQPRVEIRKGKEPLSCIIGFLDKKDQFKEYKKVSIKKDQLKISTLNSYFVGVYRTKSKSS